MKSLNEFTWAPIIPLIGGESIGVMNYLEGKLPEYVLTYPAFKNNDAHFLQYLEKRGFTGKHILIDPLTNDLIDPDEARFISTVDIMCAVPPCAGLSSLNSRSGGGCPQNDWMYLSAEFALKYIKPKVLFGENAPRLGTASGKLVRDGLYKIARKYGYTFAIFKTASIKHGLCQKRPRTFYFLFNDTQVPSLNFYNRDIKPFGEQIAGDLHSDDPMNVSTGVFFGKPSENAFYKYIIEEIHGLKTHAEFISQLDTDEPIIAYIPKMEGSFNRFIKWADKNGYTKEHKRAVSMQMKLDDDKGYWGHGLIAVPGHGVSPSYVSAAPYGLMHHADDRYLTLREGLRLMGMPEDFEVIGGAKNTNHVCQNVPVTTAQDMAEQCVNYINGKLDMLDSTYVTFDNHSQKVIFETITNTLEQFFAQQ